MSRLLQGSPKHPRSSPTAAAPPINLGPVFKQGSTEQTGRDGELGLSVTALGTETPWPMLLTHGGKGKGGLSQGGSGPEGGTGEHWGHQWQAQHSPKGRVLQTGQICPFLVNFLIPHPSVGATLRLLPPSSQNPR